MGAVTIEVLYRGFVRAVTIGDFCRVCGRCIIENKRTGQVDIQVGGDVCMAEIDTTVNRNF
jgi:hypothetical protein